MLSNIKTEKWTCTACVLPCKTEIHYHAGSRVYLDEQDNRDRFTNKYCPCGESSPEWVKDGSK